MFDEKSYNLKMDKTIEVFTKELSSLRTGRANAAMLDLVKVDVYGQQMPINQVGVFIYLFFDDHRVYTFFEHTKHFESLAPR